MGVAVADKYVVQVDRFLKPRLTFLTNALLQRSPTYFFPGTPDATHPGRGLKTAHAHPLFGLAPGGVYHAGRVAEAPVGSYPTLSPLP